MIHGNSHNKINRYIGHSNPIGITNNECAICSFTPTFFVVRFRFTFDLGIYILYFSLNHPNRFQSDWLERENTTKNGHSFKAWIFDWDVCLITSNNDFIIKDWSPSVQCVYVGYPWAPRECHSQSFGTSTI